MDICDDSSDRNRQGTDTGHTAPQQSVSRAGTATRRADRRTGLVRAPTWAGGAGGFRGPGSSAGRRKTLLRRKTSAGLRANANPLKNCWATSAHTKTLRTRGLSPQLTHWKLRTPNCPLSLGDENPEVVRSTRRKHETARRPEGYDFVVTS